MAQQLTGFSSGSSFSGARLPFPRQSRQGIDYALGQLGSLQQQQDRPFSELLQEIGGTPATFTDIPQSAFLTPEVLDQMSNALFAQGAARTGAQQQAIREQTIPGATSRAGLSERLAAAQRFNDALAQRESTRLRGQFAPTINRQAAMAQTNVEAQRAADDRNRRLLALTGRRDRLQRENALLSAIASLGRALPFSRSQQTSVRYSPDNRPSIFDLGGPLP